MRSRSGGAEGKMTLRYRWSESGSGHVEQTDTVSLEALDASSVVLCELTEVSKFLPHENSKHEKRYCLTVDELIAFVKEHGKPVL